MQGDHPDQGRFSDRHTGGAIVITKYRKVKYCNSDVCRGETGFAQAQNTFLNYPEQIELIYLQGETNGIFGKENYPVY